MREPVDRYPPPTVSTLATPLQPPFYYISHHSLYHLTTKNKNMVLSKLPIQRCNSLSTIDEIDKADVVVLGIPLYDGRPYKFISPSNLLRIHTHIVESNLYGSNTYTDSLKIYDLGDLTSSSYKHLDTDLPTILNQMNREYGEKKYIFIGGDHTVTYFTVKNLEVDTIVILDAHLDLKEAYLHRKFNHATVFRRLLDTKKELKLLYYGVRGYDEEEMMYTKNSKNIHILDRVEDIELYDLGNTYISMDLDVYDPSLIRQVEYPEPNGVSLEDVVRLLGIISSYTQIVSLDIVEYLPTTVDRSEITLILRTLYQAAYHM